MTLCVAYCSAINLRKGCGTCSKRRQQCKLREQVWACLCRSALWVGMDALNANICLELGHREMEKTSVNHGSQSFHSMLTSAAGAVSGAVEED